jgi:two-component system nitrogen regulation response regulator GlnG
LDTSDYTTTSPLAAITDASEPLLSLTILWHPLAERIGQQWFGPGAAGAIEVSRYAPLFGALRREGLPLGERSIARAPLTLRRDADDGVTIEAADSRMVVTVNGEPLGARRHLRRQDVAAGVVLALGGTTVLCLHWMDTLPKASALHSVVGVGAAAIRLREQIAQVARTDLPVLLLGETGTGKEVAARAIHAASRRAGSRLVCVNMATLNEALAAADLFGAVKGAYTGAQQARQGLFAEAQDGTLFLDEIGDTPPTIQPMLLRVIESGEYRPLGGQTALRSNARLIAATDQDLQQRAFNQPLLRRLDAFVIRIAALRERREDIGLLVAHFMGAWPQETAPVMPMALVTQLCLYDWPGNVRQLAHAVQRIGIALAAGESPSLAALLGEPAAASAQPPETLDTLNTLTTLNTPDAPDAPDAHVGAQVGKHGSAPARRSRTNLDELAPQDILDALERHHWQIQASARALGVSRPSFYKLLQAHPQIRMPETIPAAELSAAVEQHGGDLISCASSLKTPSEALRRYLRAIGLLS